MTITNVDAAECAVAAVMPRTLSFEPVLCGSRTTPSLLADSVGKPAKGQPYQRSRRIAMTLLYFLKRKLHGPC